jgi:hypothetical protein
MGWTYWSTFDERDLVHTASVLLTGLAHLGAVKITATANLEAVGGEPSPCPQTRGKRMRRRGFLASLIGLIAAKKMLPTAGEPVVAAPPPPAPEPVFRFTRLSASMTGNAAATMRWQVQRDDGTWADFDSPWNVNSSWTANL